MTSPRLRLVCGSGVSSGLSSRFLYMRWLRRRSLLKVAGPSVDSAVEDNFLESLEEDEEVEGEEEVVEEDVVRVVVGGGVVVVVAVMDSFSWWLDLDEDLDEEDLLLSFFFLESRVELDKEEDKGDEDDSFLELLLWCSLSFFLSSFSFLSFSFSFSFSLSFSLSFFSLGSFPASLGSREALGESERDARRGSRDASPLRLGSLEASPPDARCSCASLGSRDVASWARDLDSG